MIKHLYQVLLDSYLLIKRKVLIKLILFVVIPNIFFLVIIHQLMNQQIEQNIEDIDGTLHMIGYATTREIQKLFDDVTVLTNHILVETEIQRILSTGIDSEIAPWSRQKEIENNEYVNQETMRSILSQYRLIWNNISSLIVISKEGDVYMNTSAGADFQIDEDHLSRSILLKEVSSSEQNGLAWSLNDPLTQNENMITFARKIYGMYAPQKVIGYVVVNLSLNTVKKSFETYSYYDDMIFGMVSHNERTWMSFDKKGFVGGQADTLPFKLSYLPDTFFSLHWNDRTWRTKVNKTENEDYLFVGIDEEYIHQQTREVRNRLYLGYAFFLLLACLISLQGTKMISSKLEKLNKAIKSFGQKKWGTRVEMKGNDEFGIMANTFNLMAIEIEELLKDLKKQQQLKRSFELRVLEYQINPHFLYNTLDSINWLSLESGKSQVSEMVTGLSKLFRLILSKGKEVITLKEEFEMIQIYLDIQKIRFGDRFEYQIDLEPDIQFHPISKLVLQPIVENAIVHGIRRLRNQGHILLTGKQVEDEIILEITDNGVGMLPEELEKQLEKLNSSIFDDEIITQSGYGMKNVDSRLKLLYGENYYMLIRSSQNQPSGTTVQIIIKKSVMLKNS